MKKCPPGIICLDINSMLIIVFCICVFLFGMFFLKLSHQTILFNNNKPSEKIVIDKKESPYTSMLYPNYPYSNIPYDVLRNPYTPPLSNDRYLLPNFQYIPPGTLPINISTNIGAINTNYRQIGILTALHSKGKILPLLGRPIFTNRDKWQYYTMSDQNNSVKLPVSQNGKSCTSEYGCNRLYDGDTVYVEGINQPYKITIYENETMRYLPF